MSYKPLLQIIQIFITFRLLEYQLWLHFDHLWYYFHAERVVNRSRFRLRTPAATESRSYIQTAPDLRTPDPTNISAGWRSFAKGSQKNCKETAHGWRTKVATRDANYSPLTARVYYSRNIRAGCPTFEQATQWTEQRQLSVQLCSMRHWSVWHYASKLTVTTILTLKLSLLYILPTI